MDELQFSFAKVDALKKEIEDLNKVDPLTLIIKEKFQIDIAKHVTSLNQGETKNPKDTILKSSTARGNKIADAVELQKKVYLDLGRNIAVTLFMFDMVSKPLTTTDVLFFYEILFSESEFRDHEVVLTSQSGNQINFPNSQKLTRLMEELLNWLSTEQKKSDTHPLIIAAKFHHKFSQIHPFSDGNGRISRLLLDIVLMNNGYLPILISQDEKNEYYGSLEKADQRDYSPLINFILEKQQKVLESFVQSPEYLSIKTKTELEEQLKKIKGTEKCFVLTEDSSSGDLLKLVLEASGFNMQQTTVIAYSGSSNIVYATLFSEFVKQKLPHVFIIVHRDKDYLTTKELIKQKNQFDKINVEFFVTSGTDIESYFVNPTHINYCHPEVALDFASRIINESIIEAEETSLRKFKIKEFGEKYKEKYSHLDDALIKIYESDIFRFTHGKTVSGIVKKKIQDFLKSNPHIDVLSPYIKDNDLTSFSKKIWSQ
ncbi:MAG: Fic family protein [Chitinophagaceae bacterium]